MLDKWCLASSEPCRCIFHLGNFRSQQETLSPERWHWWGSEHTKTSPSSRSPYTVYILCFSVYYSLGTFSCGWMSCYISSKIWLYSIKQCILTSYLNVFAIRHFSFCAIINNCCILTCAYIFKIASDYFFIINTSK